MWTRPAPVAVRLRPPSAICSGCAQSWDSFGHQFLTHSLTSVTEEEISPAPETALFGVVPAEVAISGAQSDAIAFLSLLARRLILFNWKSAMPPTHRRWVGDVMAHLKLEKLRHSTRGSTQRFYKIWQPFLDYFNLEFPARDADIAT